MKILQIVNRVPWPLKDGGAIGYYNYTKGYHDAGCDVTVAALNTSKHFVDMNLLPVEVKSLADWRTTFIDNKVKPFDAFINLFSNKSYHIERFVSDDFKQLLKNLLQEKKFDVIVFESLFVASYFDAVANNSDALLVLRQHNVEHKIWETLAYEEKGFLKKKYLSLLTIRLKKFEISQLNKFDALTTVTQNDIDDFKNLGCTKPIFSSPTGIDISILKVDDSNLELPSIFHIGSMEWMPNQQAILWFINTVWNNISEKFSELKLYLAGRGMPDSFKQFQNKNLVIKGEVEDAIKFIQSKQIMIVPLFSGSGIRIKILEGMALGKAIISTSLGAQGIDIENGKHLIIADTSEEFIEAISKLVSDIKLASELGNNARKLIEEKYDNTKVIEKMLEFYNDQINTLKTK
jgi:polysaccharide biosynthesis protein PslH